MFPNVFFTSSLLKQFTSSLTTSASYGLKSLSFSFISFSKYSIHLFNTASKLTITLLFLSFKSLMCIFPCSVSLPSQSVQLLFTFFCFQSSIQIFIHMSLHHCNCLLCLTLVFFVYLFSIFISYFVPCFFCLFLFFYALLNFLIPPPYLHFVSQMSLPVQFQLFFLAFLLFCPTHQVTHPCLPKSWSSLV